MFGYAIVDAAGRVAWSSVDGIGSRTVASAAHSAEGVDFLELVHPEDRDRVCSAAISAITRGVSSPVRIRAASGHREYEAVYRRIEAGLLVRWRRVFNNPLTGRETEVLLGVCDGLTNDAIARKARLSVSTIETYRQRIAEKLSLHGTALQVRWAIRNGLVQP